VHYIAHALFIVISSALYRVSLSNKDYMNE